MPEATLITAGLGDRTPDQLSARRQEIIETLKTKYKGYGDPEVPIELLEELSIVTVALRRNNSGPPKKPAKTKAAPTVLGDFA